MILDADNKEGVIFKLLLNKFVVFPLIFKFTINPFKSVLVGWVGQNKRNCQHDGFLI